MSTEYQFSDLKFTEKCRRFNESVQQIRKQCIQQVKDLTDDPELENAKEFILDNLQHHNPFLTWYPDEDDWVVGTCTVKEFYWRRDNGFSDIGSVQEFQERHPHLTLVDEYDRPVTVKELEQLIQSRNQK